MSKYINKTTASYITKEQSLKLQNKDAIVEVANDDYTTILEYIDKKLAKLTRQKKETQKHIEIADIVCKSDAKMFRAKLEALDKSIEKEEAKYAKYLAEKENNSVKEE